MFKNHRFLWTLSVCLGVLGLLGVLMTSAVEAQEPKGNTITSVDGEVPGLLIERNDESVIYTVTDPNFSFMILGVPVSDGDEVNPTPCTACGDQVPTIQACPMGKSVKVRADKPSRAFKMEISAICNADVCFPCLDGANCTEPMPPPDPDPIPFHEAFLLNSDRWFGNPDQFEGYR